MLRIVYRGERFKLALQCAFSGLCGLFAIWSPLRPGPRIRRIPASAIPDARGLATRSSRTWRCSRQGSLDDRDTRDAGGDHLEDALDAWVMPPLFERLVAQERGLDGDSLTQTATLARKGRCVQREVVG